MLAGVVNEIVACPLLAVATTFVGADETVAGTTELLVPEDEPVPTPFVAVTVNVYVTPFVKPVIVIGEVVPIALKPPIFDVTV